VGHTGQTRGSEVLERSWCEAAFKTERRIERRIATSGMAERKTLEGFDWIIQPALDKSAVMNIATWNSSATRKTWS